MQKHTTMKPLNQNKMKNIHVIPTSQPSRLRYNLSNVLVFTKELCRDYGKQVNRNIYITSDEEIKEEDWFYNTISLKPEPFKACENGDGYVNCSRYSHYRIDCKKIILTTDQDLIKDGVQKIDDEFLEWFVKNPSCEEVEVEKENICARCHSNDVNDCWSAKECSDGKFDKIKYKIIIPTEEPKYTTSNLDNEKYKDFSVAKQTVQEYEQQGLEKYSYKLEPKQETLKEAAERLYPFNPYSIGNGIKYDEYAKERRCFKEGAEWQQERMYSEEDLKEAFEAGHKKGFSGYPNTENWKELPFEKWFEQFKKK